MSRILKRAARATALPFLLLASAAAAQENPQVTRLLEQGRQACASFENGEFDPGDAVTRAMVGLSEVEAIFVDESRFSCSSAASMYCGSGGCMLHAVVGETVTSWQATGWRVVDWNGDALLLIGRDGGWCGGAGADWCYEALNWLDGRFLTVMPPPG